MDTITVTDKEVRVVRRVCQVDERGSYRRDANYPKLIFLATVLRWTVNGCVTGEQADNRRKIVRNKQPRGLPRGCLFQTDIALAPLVPAH